MSNPKWETGPVKLANGWDATIYRYCENRKRYIGEVKDNDGWFCAAEWMDDGSWYYKNSPNNLLNLFPPKKKTVRLKRWLNIYLEEGRVSCGFTQQKREDCDTAEKTRFACIEIDREVTEGEGL